MTGRAEYWAWYVELSVQGVLWVAVAVLPWVAAW